MEFKQSVFISFAQADPAGILFFSEVFNLHHWVIEQWARQTSFGWEGWFSSPEWAVPLKHVECAYKKPILAGQDYAVTLKLSKLGDSSCCWQSQFISNGEVHALVDSVHIFIDKGTGRPRSIPAAIRASLKQVLA